MSDLKIEYVKIDDLKTYPGNAKIHTAEQVEQIKESIEQFGFNDPVAVWKDNEIIEGHGRLIAATELGMEEVPVIRLDDLTDEQRRAYMLVHNKLTMNTGFDFSMLSEELKKLDDFDMSDFGFGNFEINTYNAEILPAEYNSEELGSYGEGETITTVITISCATDEELEFMRGLLKEEGETRKLYRASVVMERYEQNRS